MGESIKTARLIYISLGSHGKSPRFRCGVTERGAGNFEAFAGNYRANYGKNVGKPTPVGRYPTNRYGLYDMAGNVWE